MDIGALVPWVGAFFSFLLYVLKTMINARERRNSVDTAATQTVVSLFPATVAEATQLRQEVRDQGQALGALRSQVMQLELRVQALDREIVERKREVAALQSLATANYDTIARLNRELQYLRTERDHLKEQLRICHAAKVA